jgi:hypothetical protein
LVKVFFEECGDVGVGGVWLQSLVIESLHAEASPLRGVFLLFFGLECCLVEVSSCYRDFWTSVPVLEQVLKHLL